MAKRILITGGAGFIGSTIADLFLQAGWDVAVLDDLSSGKRENVPAGARFYPVDVRGGAESHQVLIERAKIIHRGFDRSESAAGAATPRVTFHQ